MKERRHGRNLKKNPREHMKCTTIVIELNTKTEIDDIKKSREERDLCSIKGTLPRKSQAKLKKSEKGLIGPGAINLGLL